MAHSSPFRWLFFDYVDPQFDLTREQRATARRLARSAMYRAMAYGQRDASLTWIRKIGGRKFWWIGMGQALIPGAVMAVVLIGWQWLGFTGFWSIAPLMLTQILLTWLLMAWIGRILWKPWVAIALREMGYTTCLRCGYWLRGLEDDPADRCPECGEPIEPAAATPSVPPSPTTRHPAQ